MGDGPPPERALDRSSALIPFAETLPAELVEQLRQGAHEARGTPALPAPVDLVVEYVGALAAIPGRSLPASDKQSGPSVGCTAWTSLPVRPKSSRCGRRHL